jgi:hypothetical protein
LTGACFGILIFAALFTVYEIARISLESEVLTQIAQTLIWIGGNLVWVFYQHKPPARVRAAQAGSRSSALRSRQFFGGAAFYRAQQRYARDGRTVRVAWAPEGMDFDDLLREAA